MEIRMLKMFRHLAESRHFGRTSQACNITPSALTRKVQRMEEELGEKLFIRDNRSVSLTPAGELFREYAEEVIQMWNELKNRVSDDGQLRGEISLYCSVTAVYSILSTILERFRKEYPGVHIKLQTGDAALALNKLESREVDLSIAALPDRESAPFEFIKIIETPLVFIAPVHCSEIIVYNRKMISWHQTPLIMAETGLSRQAVEAWFKKRRVHPNIYAYVAGNEAIISMVTLGCGVGVVPLLVLEKSPLKDQVWIMDVKPDLPPFSVGVCTARINLLNPIVSAFWRIAEQGAVG